MVLSKIKSSKKAQAAKGFLEKNVPIPAHFYAGKTDEDLMAPKRASRRKSIFFFLTFSCECARYSAPLPTTHHRSLPTILSRRGHPTLRPGAQPLPHRRVRRLHGVLLPARLVPHGDIHRARLRFRCVPSRRAIRTASSRPFLSLIRSTHAGGEAYNCTPLIADTAYGLRFNYDTCRELMVSEARPSRASQLFSQSNRATPTRPTD